MSHDLEIIDGMAQAMFERVPWHQLGTVVDANFGWEDAMAANLTITMPVQKVPMTELVLGYQCQDDEFAAVRGDGCVLKTGLGEQWTPFPAVEGYAFGQCIREQANEDGIQADLRSLGTLARGRKWFMTFDLGTFTIGDLNVRDYLSVNGSYDSSWPLQVLTSPIIEVCANTVAAAKASGVTHFRYKHTSGIFDRVAVAKASIKRHAANRAAFKLMGDKLASTPVSPVQYAKFMDLLFPIDKDTPTKTKNARTTAIEQVGLVYKSEGHNVVSGTGNGLAVVQAVNTYENWGSPIRNTKGRSEAETRATRQIESLVDGDQPLTSKAIELVLA